MRMHELEYLNSINDHIKLPSISQHIQYQAGSSILREMR